MYNQEANPLSHIVSIQSEVRDAEAVKLACRRLGLAQPCQETVRLFSGHATGLTVRLPNWRYPVVCETSTGTLRFDNYHGRWGDQKHLDRFLQIYSAEKAKLEARRRGHAVTEQTLADGTIKLTIQVPGGAA